MFNWIRKYWKLFEEMSDKQLEQYLENITIQDAKPCPFCGEKIIRCFDYKTSIIGGLTIYRATCTTCTTCGATVGQSLSRENAKKQWNQRVNTIKEFQ